MKEILKEWKKFLTESSLSRLYQHISEHDTAIITAFRNDPSDISKCAEDAVPSEPDETNMIRNRDLKATLLSLQYGVTKVRGTYIEDFDTAEAVEVGENSLFVVNLLDEPEFFDLIADLGEKYCQDSVLMIPRGGQNAFLRGTNNSEFPGHGENVPVGSLTMGEEAEFMTRVQDRPFTFGEGLDIYKNLSRNERMAVKSIAKKILG